MLLNYFILDTGIDFSIPLSKKISIKNDDYFIKLLTINIFKKYIWKCKNNIFKDLTNDAFKLELWYVNIKEIVNIFNEDDIIQKLKGNKMKPNFVFSKYFIGKPLAKKIYIII